MDEKAKTDFDVMNREHRFTLSKLSHMWQTQSNDTELSDWKRFIPTL